MTEYQYKFNYAFPHQDMWESFIHQSPFGSNVKHLLHSQDIDLQYINYVGNTADNIDVVFTVKVDPDQTYDRVGQVVKRAVMSANQAYAHCTGKKMDLERKQK